jgi:xylulokinase
MYGIVLRIRAIMAGQLRFVHVRGSARHHCSGPAVIMRLVAGIDSSTQSTKVEIRDLGNGEIVARGSAPHPATTPPRSEQVPDAWWTAFESAWAAAGSPRVEAISVAGQQHGMVVLDADREVIRPAKLWNDTESAADAGRLIEQLPGGAAGWAAAVGSVPVAAFTVTKLSWLHRSEPDNWARLAHVLLPHDWMTMRLTGELVTDRGDASGTGYWSPSTGEYRYDILAIIDNDRDWSTVMPRVADATEVVGEWSDAKVACGTGDNMAAALGLGLQPGVAVLSLGTSGTAYALSRHPTADQSGAVAGFADASGRYLPLACTLNATKVTDAIAGLLGVDHDEFDRLALAAPSGSGGVTLLPYFDGERTPNLPESTGLLAGIRSDVSRQQVARAAVEGVVCGLLEALDALRSHTPVTAVRVVGGGARSEAYRQVVTELCDLPVQLADAEQAVATGACVQAAAVALAITHAEVADRWGLGVATPLPSPAGDSAGVRARYADLRAATHPSTA